MRLHLLKLIKALFDTEDGKHATVVVPDDKLSLAIGRRGQNVRFGDTF